MYYCSENINVINRQEFCSFKYSHRMLLIVCFSFSLSPFIWLFELSLFRTFVCSVCLEIEKEGSVGGNSSLDLVLLRTWAQRTEAHI